VLSDQQDPAAQVPDQVGHLAEAARLLQRHEVGDPGHQPDQGQCEHQQTDGQLPGAHGVFQQPQHRQPDRPHQEQPGQGEVQPQDRPPEFHHVLLSEGQKHLGQRLHEEQPELAQTHPRQLHRLHRGGDNPLAGPTQLHPVDQL